MERETEGQIGESEVIRELLRYDDLICAWFNSVLGKEVNYEANFSSESFPILMF